MPHRFRTSDGVEIAWHELAAGNTMPPILLQHGFTATTQSEWIDPGIVNALRKLGRRIIAVDARGHGASEKPHDNRYYGEARMAHDISELVTELDVPSLDLVGYSMGAIVSLLVATADRRLRRLAIGGVGEAVVVLGGVDTRALSNTVLANVLRADDYRSFPDHVIRFRTGADARGNDRFAMAAQADVVHASPVPLDRISAPTLLIAGDDDPLAVKPQVLADAIPDAKLVIVPGGDHGSTRTSPIFTEALLDFLK